MVQFKNWLFCLFVQALASEFFLRFSTGKDYKPDFAAYLIHTKSERYAYLTIYLLLASDDRGIVYWPRKQPCILDLFGK